MAANIRSLVRLEFLKIKLLPVLMLLGLFAAGCSFRTTYTLPPVSGERLGAGEASAAIGKLAERGAEIRSVRALGTVKVTGRGQSNTFRQIYVVDDKLNFRIESLPLNSAYFFSLLAGTKGRFVFLDNAEKTARTGEVTTDLLEELLGLAIPPEDLKFYLTGTVPARLLGQSKRAEIYRDRLLGNSWFLAGSDEFFFHFSDDFGDLQRLEVWQRGIPVLKINYAWYRKINNIRVPTVLLVEVPEKRVEVEITLRKTVLNSSIPQGLFEVTPPDGFEISKH